MKPELRTMTSSTQYLTLEEFASSTSPLPSILVPRSHALRLVELCELAEMTPSKSFLDFIFSDGGDGAAYAPAPSKDGDKSDGGSHPHILVTQMALLLYLGEYAHARHLWRRHRGGAAAAAATSENGASVSNADDSAQLELLWSAARYCYLWSTGGIHSLASPSMVIGSGGGGALEMQVDASPDGGDLPLSTLALRALQACSSPRSSAEPLATYAEELVGVFRSRVNRALHDTFDKIDRDEFCLRMNLQRPSEDGPDEEGVWGEFGWKSESDGYLVSDVDAVLDEYEVDISSGTTAQDGMTGGDGDVRVRELTNIVMFFEGRMNA